VHAELRTGGRAVDAGGGAEAVTVNAVADPAETPVGAYSCLHARRCYATLRCPSVLSVAPEGRYAASTSKTGGGLQTISACGEPPTELRFELIALGRRRDDHVCTPAVGVVEVAEVVRRDDHTPNSVVRCIDKNIVERR
jgi:hypothetical protein